jgi:hypothetical protein
LVFTYVYKSILPFRCVIKFLFSFNGEVDHVADSNTTTHILVPGDCRDILALQDACPDARVVNIEWLDACISQGTRVNTDIYELS